MVRIKYNPDTNVHFWISPINDTPVQIIGDDDCVGGTDGFCIKGGMKIGLDNPKDDVYPGNDSCDVQAFLSIHHMENEKRTLFEVRNHGLEAVRDSCTSGMNVTDFESFLQTTLHLGTQFLTQAIETLNDNNLYPFTNKMCKKYVINTSKNVFGFECENAEQEKVTIKEN